MVFLSCQANVRTVHQLLPSTSFPIQYWRVSLTFGAIQGGTVPQESDQLLYLCPCNRQVKEIRWVLICLTYLSLARFQASTTVQTKSLQVWVAMHHKLVVVYERFEMAYQGAHLTTQALLHTWDQLIGCSKTLFSSYWHTFQNNPEQWRTHLSLTQEGGCLQVSFWHRGHNTCIPIHFIFVM
jgi:hypothetical protein